MGETSPNHPSQQEEDDEASQHSQSVENATAKVLFALKDDPGEEEEFYMDAPSPEAKTPQIDDSNQEGATADDKGQMETDNQKPKDLIVEYASGRAAADINAKETVSDTGKPQKMAKKTTPKRLGKDGTFSRPRGQAPSGKSWNKGKGEWEEADKPPPIVTKAPSTTRKKDGSFPRPRGRPKKGLVWDGINGKWINSKELVDTTPDRPGKATKLAGDAERRPSEAKPSEVAKIIGMEVDVAKTTFHVKDSSRSLDPWARSAKKKHKTGRYTTKTERDAGGLMPRPPGRAKKGCKWDGILGQWVSESSQLPSATHKTGSQRAKKAKYNTKSPNKYLARGASKGDSPMPPSSSKRGTKRMATGIDRTTLSPPTKKKKASAPSGRLEIDASRKTIAALARSDLWSTDESVLLAAFETITALCEGESDDVEANRQAVYDTGVHMLVVKLLESHAGSLIFQKSGISLLFRLSTTTNNRIDEGLLSVGAVEAAVSAMLKYPDDVDIQAFGCVFLGNVTNSLDSWRRIQEQANNATFLFTLIFDVLDRHTDNGMVLEAVAFLMERSMVTGGEEMMQLLSEKFHGRIGTLLLAKKKFGALQPNLNERIKSFFTALANSL
jgi:hypothetical protein